MSSERNEEIRYNPDKINEDHLISIPGIKKPYYTWLKKALFHHRVQRGWDNP